MIFSMETWDFDYSMFCLLASIALLYLRHCCYLFDLQHAPNIILIYLYRSVTCLPNRRNPLFRNARKNHTTPPFFSYLHTDVAFDA